jgi:hypothetical protein
MDNNHSNHPQQVTPEIVANVIRRILRKTFSQDNLYWLGEWFLKTIFGMLWFSKNWLSFLDTNLMPGMDRGSYIRVTEADGSTTTVNSVDGVMPTVVTTSRNARITVGKNMPFTVKGVINFLLIGAAISVITACFVVTFDLTEGTLLYLQVCIIVMMLAYLVNITGVFVKRYRMSKEQHSSGAITAVSTAFFMLLTMIYNVWFFTWFESTQLAKLFPFKYFSYIFFE